GYNKVRLLLIKPGQEDRYQKCDMRLMTQVESLHQPQERLMPYFWDHIAPELMAGHDQLVVAHGSSLRALIKKIEDISNEDTVKVEVPNAEPIVYTFDTNLHIIKKEILH